MIGSTTRRTRLSAATPAAAVPRWRHAYAVWAGSRPARWGRAVSVSGLMSGHLYLSGVMGAPASRRGGGRLKIESGRIYRVPIVWALLNVLNLAIPKENALEEARADFYVVGNEVRFEAIRLRGDALVLVGSGSMSLPDYGVNLGLVSVNPHRWARVPVLAEFMEHASREFVELRVTGPARSPTVRAIPFRGISEELKRLFRKKSPKKVQPASS